MHKLTHFRLCPHSRSIRLALAELAMDFGLAEERPWEWRAEFLALNPSGDLPVLEMEGGPTLAGAYAISEFLGETQDRGHDGSTGVFLFPGGAEGRGEVRRVVDWCHRKLDSEVTRELLKEKLQPRMRPELSSQVPDPELMRAIRANLRYHLSYLNHLADQRPWLAGSEMSFADMAAAAHLSCADYLGEAEWDAHPVAKDWYARVKSRPSFRALLVDRVPGMPPPLHYADLDF